MRLINSDALWDDIIKQIEYCDDVLEIIERQPIIAPNQNKGAWIKFKEERDGLTWSYTICSSCGAARPFNVVGDPNYECNFCPTCGADMRGKKDE